MNGFFEYFRLLMVVTVVCFPCLNASLVLTEIHYNPKGSDDYEYLEFYNAGTETIDLTGFKLVKNAQNDGLAFSFPASTLEAGAFLLLVEDATTFAARYQTSSSAYYQENITVSGTWSGGLGNDGEVIILQDPSGQEVFQFEYDNVNDWPEEADGLGSSLELKDPAEYALLSTTADRNNHLGDGDNWRASADYHGNPGRDGAKATQSVVINEILSNTDGVVTDTVEIYNPTSNDIDIGGWYMSDSTTFTKYRIPEGTQVAAGGYATFDESHFNPNGDWNPSAGTATSTEFSFSGSKGDQIYLIQADASGNLLRLIDHVEFGATLSGESFGRWPDEEGYFTPMTTFTPGAANSGPRVGPVVITELMYNAGSASNADDLEFIEIYTNGSATESLENWTIANGVSYTFPLGTTINSGDYLIVVGFAPTDGTKLATFRAKYGLDNSVTPLGPWSGSLSNRGETLLLQRSDTNGDLLTDNNTGNTSYPLVTEDEVTYSDRGDWPSRADGTGLTLSKKNFTSWGNMGDNWRSSNELQGNLLDIGKPQREIAITEVLAHTDYPLTDTIELHNPGDSDIDISGWYLSDTSEDTSDYENFRKFRIPDGTVIKAGGFLTFDETDFNPNVNPLTGLGTPASNHFALSSAYDDDVALVEANSDGTLLRIVDHISIGPSQNGVSFVMWPDVNGRFYPSQSNTLGSVNSKPSTGTAILSEIHYNSGEFTNENELDFIEIYNSGDSTLSLQNWKLANGISFTFSSSHSISASGTLVVVGFDITNAVKLNTFRTHHGIDSSVVLAGPWSGSLSNAGETIELLKPDTLEVPIDGSSPFYPMLLSERVKYDDTSPWPTGADGQGKSLERANPYEWSDTENNWTTSSENPTPGTYLVDNFAPIFQSTPVTTATEDISYNATITATDSNPNDVPTLSLTIGADWLSLSDNGDGTANLTGTPLNDNVGSHLITISATDGTLITQQTFTIEVSNVNDAPTFTSDALTTAMATTPYAYAITTDDPDPTDTLSITPITLPDWLTLTDNNNGTATLSGTPTVAEIGNHEVTLRVDDSKTTTDQVFTIVVSELNLAPTSITLSNSSLSENIAAPYVIGSFSATDTESTDHRRIGERYTFSLVSGTGGENNDNFSIDGSNLRSLIEFNFETQTSHNIRVKVTDNAGNNLVQTFSINILDDITEDTDNDGLTEAQEDALGTSDLVEDSDNDSVSDKMEHSLGSDPSNEHSTPSTLSQSAEILNGGWLELSWFGVFNDNFDNWIYHMRLGWIYVQGTNTESLLLWDLELGWLWTSTETYPHLYCYDLEGWLYYFQVPMD